MEPIEITGDDVAIAASASILSGPDDSIFDSVFDWISNAVEVIVDPIIEWINKAVDWIVDGVTTVFNYVVGGIKSAVFWIWDTATIIYTTVMDIYGYVYNFVVNAWQTIYTAAKSAISTVWSWITDAANSVKDWIVSTANSMWDWISRTFSDLWQDISSWFSQTWDTVSSAFVEFGGMVGDWFVALPGAIAGFFIDLWDRIQATWDWFTDWISEHVLEVLANWWDEFLEKIFDFGAWVGGLFEAAWNWLNRDIPGGSPWWETVLQEIGKVVWGVLVQAPLDLIGFLVKSFSYGMTQVLEPIGEVFNEVANIFFEAIDGFVAALGPTNPDIATSHSRAITSVGMTAIVGLAGMTLASSWLKPLGGAGMGQIAAMIYDMTNFKIITGAGIAALTVAAIRTPMTYHFNELFRPNLLSEGDFMELMSRRAFTEPKTLQNPDLISAVGQLPGGGGAGYEMQYIGYRGYPSQYYGIFRELANAPLRYFPLAGIARTGFFEETWFKEALARSGYSPTAKDALMVMYEKMRDEALQGSMSGAAVTRYKEGFTTEAQFFGEMTILGYSEAQFEKYLAAAEMDYATDYLRDLIAAARDALRKGQTSVEDYRQRLLGLGIVPERVEGYVIREKARIRPAEELSPIGVPGEVYLTDTGRVEVDTIRRQRRKGLIGRGEEINALLGLGATSDYARALADNDDVRLAEKGGED